MILVILMGSNLITANKQGNIGIYFSEACNYGIRRQELRHIVLFWGRMFEISEKGERRKYLMCELNN